MPLSSALKGRKKPGREDYLGDTHGAERETLLRELL